MSFATLTQALDNNLSESNKINYLTSNNEESDVTFKDLKQRALGILFHLQQISIKAGDQLIIHTDNNEFFLDIFFNPYLRRGKKKGSDPCWQGHYLIRPDALPLEYPVQQGWFVAGPYKFFAVSTFASSVS